MRRVCVFCGSAAGARPEYAAAAEALGRAIGARGMGLVFGGGAVGLMGIVARAALAAGAPVTGIIPHGLVVREAGFRDLPDLRVVGSMHERKALMAELSDGFVVIHRKGVVFVDTLGFWSRQMDMLDHMVADGFLKPEMRRMALVAPDAEGALDALAGFAAPDTPRWLRPGEA